MNTFQKYFYTFEIISIAIFSIEYVIRAIAGKRKYVFSLLGIIDLLAICPFFVSALDLRWLRIVRIFRVFRILKIYRYSNSLKLIVSVFRSKKEMLFICFFSAAIIILLAGILMFYLEHEMQPKLFSDIPSTLWWAMVSLTTVGYGDIYPITAIGKILATIVSFLGIAIVALPSGIIAAGFVEESAKMKDKGD